MTEKDYNPKLKEKKAMAKSVVADKSKKKADVNPVAEAKADVKKQEKQPENNVKEKPKEKTKPKEKKTEAVINSHNVPISTKKSCAVCKMIKGMTIENAIQKLEKVVAGKKAVPMKGEIPHRKGRIMSGRFPKDTAKEFIIILKGLAGNAAVNEIDEPIIVEAVANLASRPYGKFGRVQRKRTHLKITAREKKMIKKPKKKKGGKNN